MRTGLSLASAFLVLITAFPAAANPEPPATYDARTTGMGGIALTTADNASSVYHNPAQLDQIERFSATVVLTSLLVNLSAPFAGAGSEQESGIIYAPLFFVGAAGRVAENVTLGFGAYVYTGFGGGFGDVGCISYRQEQNGAHPDCDDTGFAGRFDPARDQEVLLFVTELALSAQVSLLDNLSLGASLRIPWAQQTVSATQEAFGAFVDAEQSVSGVGDPGVLVGLTYRPTDDFSIAFAYRSKVAIQMSGTTETSVLGTPLNLETTTTWYVPHMVRMGISHQFFNKRLLLATEFKVQLHRTANDRQVFENTGDIPNTTVADLGWRNAYVWTLGAEFMATPQVPVRLG
ncbi:MAG: outer membrane protein transport protein, partial [Myxococcota bacterium]